MDAFDNLFWRDEGEANLGRLIRGDQCVQIIRQIHLEILIWNPRSSINQL